MGNFNKKIKRKKIKLPPPSTPEAVFTTLNLFVTYELAHKAVLHYTWLERLIRDKDLFGTFVSRTENEVL